MNIESSISEFFSDFGFVFENEGVERAAIAAMAATDDDLKLDVVKAVRRALFPFLARCSAGAIEHGRGVVETLRSNSAKRWSGLDQSSRSGWAVGRHVGLVEDKILELVMDSSDTNAVDGKECDFTDIMRESVRIMSGNWRPTYTLVSVDMYSTMMRSSWWPASGVVDSMPYFNTALKVCPRLEGKCVMFGSAERLEVVFDPFLSTRNSEFEDIVETRMILLPKHPVSVSVVFQ